MKNIKLYCGDCIKIMDTLIGKGVKVDAVITDLPYGVTKCNWDVVIPFDRMWFTLKKLIRVNTPVILFGIEPFSSLLRCSNLDDYRYDIYWQKERPTNIFQVKKRPGKVIENICVFYKKQPVYNPQMVLYKGKPVTNKVKNGKLGNLVDSSNKKPYEYKDNGLRYPVQIQQFQRDVLTCNLHPTQKPLALMEWLVKTYTNEGDLVLDFTMGSGTTGVACVRLKRKFIGIEIDNDMFNMAKMRIKDERRKSKTN